MQVLSGCMHESVKIEYSRIRTYYKGIRGNIRKYTEKLSKIRMQRAGGAPRRGVGGQGLPAVRGLSMIRLIILDCPFRENGSKIMIFQRFFIFSKIFSKKRRFF